MINVCLFALAKSNGQKFWDSFSRKFKINDVYFSGQRRLEQRTINDYVDTACVELCWIGVNLGYIFHQIIVIDRKTILLSTIILKYDKKQ